MRVEFKEIHLNIVVDALKLWIQHYEERGYGPQDAITAASMILKFNETAGAILDNAQNEPEQEDDETLVRGPNTGEHFVYGKEGYQKNK